MVANPPFSDKTWSHGITPSADPYQRFVWGSPGEKGDYAYLLHIIRSMKCNGKAACILPHGVLFRGNAEAVIRKKLVRSGYLKGIIGLPANLFYGIPIPACILVLDKKNVNAHKGIFMINASKGFIKDGPKNRLREQDIHRIVDTFNRQTDTPRYARIVPIEEVADPKNNYNLNLPRYIDSSEPEDIQDIRAHLNGGIPNRDIDGDKKAIPPSEGLNHYWAVMPSLRIALFKNNGHKDYSELRVEIKKIKATISGHEEFAAFKAIITGIFDKWQAANVKRLKGFDQDGQPKELITTIAEDLLAAFKAAPLLDCYGMYQHLMDYWVATMQDDCYLIAADGWVAETRRVLEKVKSGKKKGEMREKGWACDLIPKRYIVARYFAKQRGEIEALQTELDDVSASLTELAEEHDGDEGALKDVSTKGDAEEAYTKALIAVWDEDDNAACDRYNSSIDEAQEYAVELRELTDHHNISVLKNRRG